MHQIERAAWRPRLDEGRPNADEVVVALVCSINIFNSRDYMNFPRTQAKLVKLLGEQE